MKLTLPNEIWVLIKSFLFVPTQDIPPEMEFIRLENQKVSTRKYDNKLDFSKYKNQNVLIRNLRTHCGTYVDIFFNNVYHCDRFRDDKKTRLCMGQDYHHDCSSILPMKYNTTPMFYKGINPDECEVSVPGELHEYTMYTYEVYKPKIQQPRHAFIFSNIYIECTYKYETNITDENIIGVTISTYNKGPPYIKLKKYKNMVFMFKKCIPTKDDNILFYQKVYTQNSKIPVNQIKKRLRYYILHYWSYD